MPEAEIEARRLSRLEISEVDLADFTSPLCRELGLTGEIHSTPCYSVTQRWAEALAAAGFGGIRYLLRHDPSMRCVGVALFGPSGPSSRPMSYGKPISRELLEVVEERFGIRVWPTP